MFIKEITLCGFKSYREQTVINDLHDGLNVIVGRNGSGKSNIFAAIEFALTMESRHLKSQARHSLLSESRNPATPAFVEIMFDNVDRKLPINEDVVTFRRVLATKKDRFYVNGRELFNADKVLEAAGFMNPYFIVKQGKVQDLALASDAQRLKIISDVVGTTVLNDKIASCRKSIMDADGKKKEIKEMLQDLILRKEALEAEANEHKRFLKLDQSKRAIEYVIYERKLRELQKNLDELENRRSNFAMRQAPLRNKLEKTTRNLKLMKKDMEAFNLRKSEIESLMQHHEAAMNDVVKNIANAKHELEDLQKSIKFTGKIDLNSLEKKISETEQVLEEKENDIVSLKARIDSLSKKNQQLDVRMKAFAEKNAITNRDDCQEHLKKQLSVLSQNLKENEKKIAAAETFRYEAENLLETEKEKLQELQQTLSGVIDQIKATCQHVEEYQSQEIQLRNQLQAIWLETSETEQKRVQKAERVAVLEEECRKTYGTAIMEGLRGVRKIIAGFKAAGTHTDICDGYHGLVCENIQCDPKLDVAVEASAGKRLVHHVVQSAHVANIILREFNARKYGGEVNFIPISGLRTSESQSQSFSVGELLQGVKPMMSEIQVINDAVLPVADYIFGKTLLCDTLKSGAEMMRKFKCQCVTIDGDKVSNDGVMTGGYIRRSPQKLELQRTKSVDENELNELTKKKASLDCNSQNLKEKLQATKKKLEQYRAQKTKFEAEKLSVLSEITTIEKKMSPIKNSIDEADRRICDLKAIIAALWEQKEIFQSGDGTSKDKKNTLRNFRVSAESKENISLEREYAEKQKEKSSLEAMLQQLKKSYYKELESSCSIDGETNTKQISVIKELMMALNQQKADIELKHDSAKMELAVIRKEGAEKQKLADNLTEKETELKDQLKNICAKLDAFTDQYTKCSTKLQEFSEAAASALGLVPPNVEKFETYGERQLCERLRKTNAKLKDLAKVGVNQKAIQQFQEIAEKLTEFEEKLLYTSEERKELMLFLKDLETKRGEAMLQNFRTLQEQFQSIFCSVVPKGNAELILYGKEVSIDRGRSIESEQLREMAGQNLFEGVKINVNFLGKKLNSARTLAPLSGGQKSIIALCLILAIQTIDPVPFYLFDEVDQALDGTYRDSVAKVVGRMSEKSQFICTTFRKEFVDVADQIYGVSFQNRVSKIQPISETRAIDFVESDKSQSSMESNISPNGSFFHNNSAA